MKEPTVFEGTPTVWRVGRKLGRTLYIGDTCVGMVDTPELAAQIVVAMNAASGDPNFRFIGGEIVRTREGRCGG